MNPAPSIPTPPRYTHIIVFSVLAAVCLVLVLIGAILVGKNSPEAVKRDPSTGVSRQRGIVLIVIGCIGAAAFGAFTGYAGHNYSKLTERKRGFDMYHQSANMTFGPVKIEGLGRKLKEMGVDAMHSVSTRLPKF